MNEAGREQAARTALLLSQSLDGSRPETIVASPLARAFETASIIGTQLGATVRTNPDLRELNQGDYEGWVIDELPVAFRRKWDQAPGDLEFPNGESLRDLQKRAVRAFKRVLAENEGARTIPVLVSHNLTIATILSDLLKKDLDGCLALCCPPCTPRGVELDATNGGRWIVRSL